MTAPNTITTYYVYEVKKGHRQGRGRFWRANRAGYTDRISEAGLYMEPEEGETYKSRLLDGLLPDLRKEEACINAEAERIDLAQNAIERRLELARDARRAKVAARAVRVDP